MNCDEVYQELTRRGVKISVSGELLTFTAPGRLDARVDCLDEALQAGSHQAGEGPGQRG